MKRLPNLISCSRIALSVVLLFLINKPVLFTIVYFLCGISDIMDGYLARSLNAKTTLGIKLDSLGDFIFYIVWLFVLLTYVDNGNSGLIIVCVVIVAIIRATNLTITRIKFMQWNVIHTIGNKLTGLVLFILLPICSITNNIPFWSIIIVGIIAFLSALEESVILIKAKSYDANKRSVLSFIASYSNFGRKLGPKLRI